MRVAVIAAELSESRAAAARERDQAKAIEAEMGFELDQLRTERRRLL